MVNSMAEEMKHASPLPNYSPSPPAPTAAARAAAVDDNVLDLSIKKNDKAEADSETAAVKDTSAEVAEHFKKAGVYDESVFSLVLPCSIS